MRAREMVFSSQLVVTMTQNGSKREVVFSCESKRVYSRDGV